MKESCVKTNESCEKTPYLSVRSDLLVIVISLFLTRIVIHWSATKIAQRFQVLNDAFNIRINEKLIYFLLPFPDTQQSPIAQLLSAYVKYNPLIGDRPRGEDGRAPYISESTNLLTIAG